MSELRPVQREVNLPALPEQMYSEIAAITSALGVPKDVLAPDEEIGYAWRELPRELRAMPPQLRGLHTPFRMQSRCIPAVPA